MTLTHVSQSRLHAGPDLDMWRPLDSLQWRPTLHYNTKQIEGVKTGGSQVVEASGQMSRPKSGPAYVDVSETLCRKRS